MTKRLFLLVLLLGLISFMSAQSRYTVTGTMVDTLNKEKVMFATVVLQTPDSTAKMVGQAVSDAQGGFQISSIPAGEYVLAAVLLGYETVRMPVTIGGEQRKVNLGDIPMKKTSTDLDEVQIVGEKPVYLIDGEKTLYNVSEDPTVQSGSAADALQNAPGVEVDVEGNVTLRGVSSVEIWINDKPSNMNADALKNFIQQMPAGTIEKIEVITNPSARYSAQGSGGIINIVTASKIKKNSFLSFGVRGSSTPDITPFISYVYANEKFSISTYLNYSYRVSKGNGESSATMFTDSGDISTYTRSTSSYLSKSHDFGLYINGSYTPDTANSLYFWAGTYPGFGNSSSNANNYYFELINPSDRSFTETSLSNSFGGGGYGGMWYEHKFNSMGHKISADVSFWTWGRNSNQSTVRDYTYLDYLDKDKKSNSKYNSLGLSASLDYTIPYHKNGEIELGVSGSYDPGKDFTRLDTLVFSTNEYVMDAIRSQDALSRDGSFDAYATLQHRFGNFTLKGGLRAEYELYNLLIKNSPADDVHKGYFGLYPSLHLSYRTKNMHNFKLSYTRRVSNPSGDQLTTYIEYGEDGFSRGNPDLLQTFTNSIEAGWTKYINKFGNVGINAYFKNSKNEISSQSDVIYSPFFNRIVSFSMPVNAGKSLNTGAEFNVMYRLKAFMNIRFYANVYYSKSSFIFRDEVTPRTVDNLGYSFRLNFWAKLWNFLEINASANYRSKSVDMFTTTKPRYSIDAGLRAEFWKRRISIHLSVSDIFNWNIMGSEINNPYYSVNSSNWNSWMGRSIRGGITFKFGKMELEASQAQAQGGGAGGGMGMGQ
ncbi:MAG: TonB-dependent receptor family protein [Bacteroidales bacterium]|nr:TonB-dependent receptor family protein [Bacteroidales bacterium]